MHWVLVAAHGISLAAASGACSLVAVPGSPIMVAFAGEHRLSGTQASVLQHVGSVAVAPGPCSLGSIVMAHNFIKLHKPLCRTRL